MRAHALRALGVFTRALVSALVALALGAAAASATALQFYSQGNLAADSLASWNSERDGSGVEPASFAEADSFVVQAGHSMITTAPWTLSLGSLEIETDGTLTASQPVTIGGDLLLSGGTLVLDAGSGSLALGGNWTRSGGNFTSNGREVVFDGGADQTVTSAGGGIPWVTVSKSGGRLLLADDLSVADSLHLTQGVIETGAHRVSLGANGRVARGSGWVAGRLEKSVAAGASEQSFEIGDDDHYTPVSVTGAAFASEFRLEASVVAGDRSGLAASGIDPARSVNRTWTLTSSDYSGGAYDLTLDFVASDLDAGAEPAGFAVRKFSSSAWTATAVADRQPESIRATGLTGFSDFSVGEQAIDHYAVSAPSPQDRGATFTTSVSALDALDQPVASDTTTAVTMSSDGAVEYDADGNAVFGDSVKVLSHGAFTIATRDTVAQTVTLTASDGNGKTGSRAGLVILAPLEIATSTLPGATAGHAYSQTLSATGGLAPYSWSLASGALPAGMSLSPSGEIAGTATLAGSSGFTVQVADAASHVATQPLAIAVAADTAAQLVVTQQPGHATAGAIIAPPFSVRVRDAFGNDVNAESLSVSVALTSGTGTLLGPSSRFSSATGTVVFDSLRIETAGADKRLTASAAFLSPAVSDTFSISADTAATVAFQVQPSNALVGATIAPPVEVKVTDAFANPVEGAGVSLTLSGTGTLGGGTPAATNASGIASFASLTVSLPGVKHLLAHVGALAPATSDSFQIGCPPIAVSPDTLPAGTRFVAYSATVGASGGQTPYTFAISSGALPAGLTLNTSSGDISGTPTAAGTFGFQVTATDSAGCSGSRAYSLVIDSGCSAIAVLPATLPDGSLTVSYSQSLSASAGHPPIGFAVTAGALPNGLALSAAGLLSGTPTVADTFSFTVTATDSLGCTGSRSYALIVHPIPAAVTNIAAQQTSSGNDNDGTVKIQITFTMPPGATTAEVWRAGFGHYPQYDDAGGSAPPVPSYPPGSPWALTSVTASGQFDEPATRDFYYYVVFVRNAGGGRSAVSNRSGGALNYHLGDVSNGIAAGAGNNQVGDEDISLLGAHYGITEPAITQAGVAYLDVGPTTDFQPTSRPFTDHRIDFEDLIVFATNYQAVSGPSLLAKAAPARAVATTGAANESFELDAPSAVEAGAEFDAALNLTAGGRMQGFSVRLEWNASVVTPEGMTSGQFVEPQGGLVLSPQPGGVDAALLGAREQGITGSGTVAVVRFRALSAGDPGIRLVEVKARDRQNQPVATGETSAPVRPSRTELMGARPNPFHGNADLVFALSSAGRVELEIFGVDGRRVRTIAKGDRDPGVYHEKWDGRDESGRVVAPGVYYVHLVAGGRKFVRSLVSIR